MVKKNDPLSRRERQIMDIVYACGEATIREIQEQLEDAPTDMAIRRLVHILEEKGHLNRRKQGRSVVYRARQSRQKAGIQALGHVIQIFFGGAIDEALAAQLSAKEKVTPEQLARMQKMIAEARKSTEL